MYSQAQNPDEGQRLGSMPGPGQNKKEVRRKITLWANGFVVDDNNELRDYYLPANQQFLNSINNG